MVQYLVDPRRLNPLLALLVLAIVIAHAAGVATPWGAQAAAPAVAVAQSASGTAPALLGQIAEAQRLARALRAHMIAAVTSNDAAASRRNMEQAAAAVADSERVVRELTTVEGAGRDNLAAQLSLTQNRLAVDGVAPVAVAVKAGNMDAARRLVLERTLERLAAHEDVLQALLGQHHERMAAAYSRAQAAAQNTYLAAVLGCVLALAGASAYVIYVRRRIVGPLELLGHVMRVVSADHNYTHRAHVSGHPAVVQLAGAFDHMMAGIQFSFDRAAGRLNSGTVERKSSISEVQALLPADLPAGRRTA